MLTAFAWFRKACSWRELHAANVQAWWRSPTRDLGACEEHHIQLLSGSLASYMLVAVAGLAPEYHI